MFNKRLNTKTRSFDTSLFARLEFNKQQQREQYRQRRLAEVQTLLTTYFADKNVTKVYLIGSILQKNQFDSFSDIDIAVAGLPSTDYFKVFGELEEVLNTEHLDLIEIEKCHFRDWIE